MNGCLDDDVIHLPLARALFQITVISSLDSERDFQNMGDHHVAAPIAV